MKTMTSNLVKKFAYGVALVASPLSAFAVVDLTPITATLTDIALVGAAMFGVFVAIKAIKLVRRAL